MLLFYRRNRVLTHWNRELHLLEDAIAATESIPRNGAEALMVHAHFATHVDCTMLNWSGSANSRLDKSDLSPLMREAESALVRQGNPRYKVHTRTSSTFIDRSATSLTRQSAWSAPLHKHTYTHITDTPLLPNGLLSIQQRLHCVIFMQLATNWLHLLYLNFSFSIPGIDFILNVYILLFNIFIGRAPRD